MQEMARFSFPSHMHDNLDVLSYSSPRLIDQFNQVKQSSHIAGNKMGEEAFVLETEKKLI